ncbi:unnamed protein product, partial [Discosporangium mesarthrocarpum]
MVAHKGEEEEHWGSIITKQEAKARLLKKSGIGLSISNSMHRISGRRLWGFQSPLPQEQQLQQQEQGRLRGSGQSDGALQAVSLNPFQAQGIAALETTRSSLDIVSTQGVGDGDGDRDSDGDGGRSGRESGGGESPVFIPAFEPQGGHGISASVGDAPLSAQRSSEKLQGTMGQKNSPGAVAQHTSEK